MPRAQKKKNAIKIALAWVGGLAIGLLVVVIGVAGTQIRPNEILVSSAASTISAEEIAELQPSADDQGLISKGLGHGQKKTCDLGKIGQAVEEARAQAQGNFGIAVGNLDGTGDRYQSAADQPMKPASTMKVMTAISSLELQGVNTRYVTKTVLDGSTVTLVGGGDPLLASDDNSHKYRDTFRPATLQDLANKTAEALKAKGLTEVNLNYDDSLFTGPAWHPAWPVEDRAWVAPVTALSVDLGNPKGHEMTQDPSGAAAQIFAEQLKAAGINIAQDPTAAAAAKTATDLASVHSNPLPAALEQLLVHSDNYVAEVLMRHNAIAAGNEPSFTGGAKTHEKVLRDLGILTTDGLVIDDGSGLSANNRITADSLLNALILAGTNEKFGYLFEAFPTAAGTGTLKHRFNDDQSGLSRGILRAKTGSLDGVSSLAGYTETQDGGLMAFAMIGNDLPLDKDPQPWLDHMAAAVTNSQCS